VESRLKRHAGKVPKMNPKFQRVSARPASRGWSGV
jgi:hypothetical protein